MIKCLSILLVFLGVVSCEEKELEGFDIQKGVELTSKDTLQDVELFRGMWYSAEKKNAIYLDGLAEDTSLVYWSLDSAEIVDWYKRGIIPGKTCRPNVHVIEGSEDFQGEILLVGMGGSRRFKYKFLDSATLVWRGDTLYKLLGRD